MEQLAKALREEMAKRNHSIRQAAAAIGVASTTVVNWSKGWVENAPDPKHWPALAEYLQVPMPVVLAWMGLLTEEQVAQLDANSATGVSRTSALSMAAA